MSKETQVRVVATGVGHDGVQVRQQGEEFDMPAGAFAVEVDKVNERTGEVTGKVKKVPSWFKAKDPEAVKEALAEEEKALA